MSKSPNFVEMGTAGTVGVADTERKVLIDLDETYDDPTNPEETEALAEYLRTGKLSKSALKNASVAGTERFEPGCTKLNGLLGGESFMQNLGERLKDFVMAVIKAINAAVTWLMNQARRVLAFFTDTREINKADAVLKDIEQKLVEMGGPALNIIDVREIFESDPVNSRRLAVVHSLRARNNSTLEAAKKLQECMPALKEFISDINRQEAGIKRANDRFNASIDKLRKRVRTSSLTNGDKAEWQAEILDLAAQSFQKQRLQRNYAKIAAIMTDRTSGNLDDDKLFAESTKALQNLMVASKDDVPMHEFVEMSQIGGQIRKAVVDNPDHFDIELDTDSLNKLTKMVKIDDMEFIKNIPDQDSGELAAIYQMYVGKVGSFTSVLRQCIDVAMKFTAEVNYLSQWSQRYDLLLSIYSLSTLEARQEKIKEIEAATGKPLDTGDLEDVPEDIRQGMDRSLQRMYDSLLPGVKREMNKLGKKLNMKVNL